ncbi:helix-turn-helix domain-containing protein [Curvibacter sp. APW13]|uniref:AraC family transcriptional regulator n=1 Tax=Curvibacter sp. APW13 TaxID=3077236 RepID=UPI0028DE0B4E|nr:helix-turn-helix domain-containing protein [Curvibacter sp. APW13]MDT8990482.1 helix-turn-helix domain-containing protein [Curvibacter sp. APW13]
MTLLLSALLSIGYSLGALLVLAATHFNAKQYPQHRGVRWAGRGLLASLGVLQVAHAFGLWAYAPAMIHMVYGAALLLVAPCFYLMAVQVLVPQRPAPRRAKVFAHLAPVLAAAVLPLAWILPLAFGLGSAYLVWLLHALWTLRAARSQWMQEVILLGLAAVVGVAVCVVGLVQVGVPTEGFFAAYACAIGFALLLVQLLLGLRPQLAQDAMDTAQAVAYATTTLGAVDVPAALARLEVLMAEQHRYRDADLSLPQLAQELGLGAHQLSELLNTRLGKGFGRYLRERRVAAAKQMLLDEPTASVLSVGLSVGFSAQSNFYEAFREIEGTTPGQYRKLFLARKQADPAGNAPN